MNLNFSITLFLLKVILYLFLSWLLIHFLSVLGIFLAIIYPLWWLLLPKRTTCLLCQVKKVGEKCFFCNKVISRPNDLSPANITSALLNGLVIIFFSLISIIFVSFESKIVFNLDLISKPKEASFVIPSKGQYSIGEVFPMKIDIADIKTPINVVQADISFDPDKIEIVDINTDDSFSNIFIQKEINNQLGFARLTGGLPNPGYSGERGIFGTILFKGKTPGFVNIKFLPTSMVLANDGNGTNVLKDLASASYLILPQEISKSQGYKQPKTSNASVLGESSTNNTQMRFYDEDYHVDVLGSSAKPEDKEKRNFDPPGIALDNWERVDKFILRIWGHIFGLEI